ncbi:hypothetical protein BC936DRAFT_148349 [Jimgerdemannia flammicorona]|uniref:ARID domain-containing protein n=1 Tax=Jimgerdemannia flammicorona TaxID=994334 RepID=A0A433D389_9FUNG|nr:hypothetical protein BC936DRAFT_148349 [Jimgerdemannia flammicorona]
MPSSTAHITYRFRPQVTQNRGWKQVGDPFNFPPTCTNSAYILKGVYTRNLLGWEEENFWRRPWVPPRDGDDGQRTRSSHHLKADKSASPAPPRTVVRDPARSTATGKHAISVASVWKVIGENSDAEMTIREDAKR